MIRPSQPIFHGAAALALGWGAFAFGSAARWAFLPLALASAVCGLAGLWMPSVDAVATSSRRPRVASWPVLWGLVAIAAAVLIQLVPIPPGLTARLSPRASGVIAQLDIAFATGLTSDHALSIAPTATTIALALYVVFAVLMFGVARIASLTGTRPMAAIVCVLGVMLAVVGIVQQPLYAGKILGFWPAPANSRPFGPFVNPNHFAGWMLMALPLTFGLLCAAAARGMAGVEPGWRNRIVWLSSPHASRAILVGAAAMVMAVSLVLTMSRSGMLAFALSVVMTSWFAMKQLPGGSKRLVIAAYLACVVALTVACVGSETIVTRFASANPSTVNERLPIWRDTWRIVSDFWLTGTGLNTYGVATLFYQTVMPEFHLREAHNDYLQLVAEGGLLLSLPVACVCVLFARDVRRRFRQSRGSSYWVRLGAVTGIVAIALQSTVEFSLQIPGNAALFAVLCGIALHHPPASRSRPGLQRTAARYPRS